MTDLLKDAEGVQSREDLARFIESLAVSLRGEQAQWANSNLADFLEAGAAWVIDMDGYFLNRGEPTPESPSWRLVAEILVAATQYE